MPNLHLAVSVTVDAADAQTVSSSTENVYVPGRSGLNIVSGVVPTTPTGITGDFGGAVVPAQDDDGDGRLVSVHVVANGIRLAW